MGIKSKEEWKEREGDESDVLLARRLLPLTARALRRRRAMRRRLTKKRPDKSASPVISANYSCRRSAYGRSGSTIRGRNCEAQRSRSRIDIASRSAYNRSLLFRYIEPRDLPRYRAKLNGNNLAK